jgi:TM2 domain-containing membrane protein YozV
MPEVPPAVISREEPAPAPQAPQPIFVPAPVYYPVQQRGISNGMAALLSFFIPGLGQLCQGRAVTGLLTFVLFVLFAVTVIGLPVAAIIWIGSVVDAARN